VRKFVKLGVVIYKVARMRSSSPGL